MQTQELIDAARNPVLAAKLLAKDHTIVRALVRHGMTSEVFERACEIYRSVPVIEQALALDFGDKLTKALAPRADGRPSQAQYRPGDTRTNAGVTYVLNENHRWTVTNADASAERAAHDASRLISSWAGEKPESVDDVQRQYDNWIRNRGYQIRLNLGGLDPWIAEMAINRASSGLTERDKDELQRSMAEGREAISTSQFNNLLRLTAQVRGVSELDVMDEVAVMSQADAVRMFRSSIESHIADRSWVEPTFLTDEKFDHETDEKYQQRMAYRAEMLIVRDKVIDTLKFLPNEYRSEAMKQFMGVVDYMPADAIRMLNENLGGIDWYRNSTDLNAGMKHIKGSFAGNIAGAWIGSDYSATGRLVLSGAGSARLSVREIYVHEVGHAIDWTAKGPDGEGGYPVSSTTEWRNAWRDEIDVEMTPLSAYAKTDPSEGFAEFSRLVFSAMRTRDIAEEFPKCYEVFRSHGLALDVKGN